MTCNNDFPIMLLTSIFLLTMLMIVVTGGILWDILRRRAERRGGEPR